MSTRRRMVAAFGACVMVAGMPGAIAMAAGGSGAEPGPVEGGCSAVLAVAQGVQVTASRSDNIVLKHPAGPGVPVAQSCVDYGLREATALASSPYPGSFLASPPVPTGYPLHARSRYPGTEESTVDEPGTKLVARSSETESIGRGRTAPDQESDIGSALAVAESSVDPAAGTSIAKATAEVQPFTIADVLTLGKVESIATARASQDGTIKRGSDLRIGQTTVAGQHVEITPRGVRAVGQNAALPDTGDVTEQLAQAGVTVRYLRAEKTSAGILSAGIDISVRNEDPSGAVTTSHIVLGRSFATAAPVDAAPTSRGGQQGAAEQVASDGGSGSVSPGPAPAVAPVAVPESAPTAAGAPAAPDAVPGPDVAGEQGATRSMALVGPPVDLGVGAVYLVIVLGGLVMFVSGTLVRLLGVKTRWTS